MAQGLARITIITLDDNLSTSLHQDPIHDTNTIHAKTPEDIDQAPESDLYLIHTTTNPDHDTLKAITRLNPEAITIAATPTKNPQLANACTTHLKTPTNPKTTHHLKGLLECITKPCLVSLDYADLKTILQTATTITPHHDEADLTALNQLLNRMTKTLANATTAFTVINAGTDITLDEIKHAANTLGQHVTHHAYGVHLDEKLTGRMAITTYAGTTP